MIKLSRRLQAVYDEITICNCLSDVGCDHGKVIVKAKQNNLCNQAIAIDLSASSLAKAGELASKHNVNIDLRLGDGVSVLNHNECDELIIAGMGGMEIIKILSSSKFNFNRYILLPHRNTYELRCYLMNNDIVPIKDYIVKENHHYYNLLTCTHGKCSCDNKSLLLGLNNIANSDYKEFLVKTKSQLEKIMPISNDSECSYNSLLYKAVCEELGG